MQDQHIRKKQMALLDWLDGKENNVIIQEVQDAFNTRERRTFFGHATGSGERAIANYFLRKYGIDIPTQDNNVLTQMSQGNGQITEQNLKELLNNVSALEQIRLEEERQAQTIALIEGYLARRAYKKRQQEQIPNPPIEEAVVLKKIVEEYNDTFKDNAGDKNAQKDEFVGKFNTTDGELSKKAEKCFDALYSHYKGAQAHDNGESISKEPTAWESVKAFLLAIVTLCMGRSTRYNKNTFAEFVQEAAKEQEREV